MWRTESQPLRLCRRYICKKLKSCWQWSLPQFSAFPQTHSSDNHAPVFMTSGDNHETFFAESNFHAYSFLDCILHFTLSVAFTALTFRKFRTHICTTILPHFLEAVGPSPRLQTSYSSRFFLMLSGDNYSWFLPNAFQFIIQKSPHNSTPYYLSY